MNDGVGARGGGCRKPSVAALPTGLSLTGESGFMLALGEGCGASTAAHVSAISLSSSPSSLSSAPLTSSKACPYLDKFRMAEQGSERKSNVVLDARRGSSISFVRPSVSTWPRDVS